MSNTNCINIKTNEKNCPCTSLDCHRHGVCCECLRAHLDRDGLPSCLKVKIQGNQLFRENILNIVNEAKA
jgi:hypothetical protein